MSASIISLRDVKREDRKEAPQAKWDPNIEVDIKVAIRAALASATSSDQIFERIQERFEAFYERPSANMLTLRRSTKQEKGRWWEHLVVMYLRAKGYATAGIWLLGDTPDEVLDELRLTRRDLGIDIVVEHDNGYFAVQAKWRSRKGRTRVQLTWKQLSTFYALAARTGPWLKHIIATNADSVRRAGKKWKMDQTIASAGFAACDRAFWAGMAGLGQGYSLISDSKEADEDDLPLGTAETVESGSTTREDTRRRQAFLGPSDGQWPWCGARSVEVKVSSVARGGGSKYSFHRSFHR